MMMMMIIIIVIIIIIIMTKTTTTNNNNSRRLRSAGDNDRKSKRFCSNAVMCSLCMFHVIDGQNIRDQITIE